MLSIMRGSWHVLAAPAAVVVAAHSVRWQRERRDLRCEAAVECSDGGRQPVRGVGWRSQRRPPHAQSEKRLIGDTDFIYRCVCRGHLSDSYTIEKEIGTGAFGKVYLARHKSLGYLRAVKKIEKDPRDEEQNSKLMNEIHALMDLDHPNIVKLVKYHDEGSVLWMVFELCQGPDLFDRICDELRRNRSGMKEEEVAGILWQMLKALKCCHDHYMGHFDIKPENFMYSKQDLATLKMIDLGLSSGFKKDNSEIKGSADYMAPETWDGFYGPEADIWSCGVVLFAMLTGKSFAQDGAEAPREDEVRKRVRDRSWVRQRLRWASTQGLSKEALDLLTRMLRHNRHQRPTVREALWHPFLQPLRVQDRYSAEIVGKAQQCLEALPQDCLDFAAEPVLVRSVRLIMAHFWAYSSEDSRPQRLAFSMVDRNADGELSVEEFEDYFYQMGRPVPESLEEAIRGVDVNADGYITYVEFLSATLPPSVRCSEDLCRVVFNLLDQSRDGYIDSRDIATAFFKGTDPHGACRAAVGEVSSGVMRSRLDWEDFLQLMQAGCRDRSRRIEETKHAKLQMVEKLNWW